MLKILLLLIILIPLAIFYHYDTTEGFIESHLDGCEEAALKLEMDMGNKYLHDFCKARDSAIREFVK